MKVNVKMKSGAIRKLSKAQAMAVSMTAEELLNRVIDSQTMPFDTGTLQNESSYVDNSKATKGVVYIVHDTPYARRLYYHPEYNFQQGKNVNAGGEWWEIYVSGSKKTIPHTLFKKFYIRCAGGYVK